MSRKGSKGRVSFLLIKFIVKSLHLMLKIGIAHGEFLVKASQAEIVPYG